MKKTNKLLLSVLILLMLLLPAGAVSADIGPKPTMDFTFVYETDQPLTIVEGQLIQCDDPECLEGAPLEELGPQGFSCTETGCSSMAYGYAGDNILVITFSDGVTRISNQFGKQNFNAVYTVTVYESELVVVETGGSGSANPLGILIGGAIAFVCLGGGLLVVLVISLIVLVRRAKNEQPLMESSRRWVIAIWVIGALFFLGSLLLSMLNLISWSLPLTILIEGVLIAVYFAYRKQPKTLPLTLNLAGNLLTQVVLWYLLVNDFADGLGWPVLIVAEVVIVGIEALILYWPMRKQLSFQHALSISFVLNLISFTIGLFLPV